ncbi:MAG TPA: response regulator transcription factor [Chthoniobacterales bacterium]
MDSIKKTRVLVADAEPVSRFGLVQLINSHPMLDVCTDVGSAPPIRELCVRHRPQVVVLNPALGGGFALIKDVLLWAAGTRVVVFAAAEDALSVQRAFRAGACSYFTHRDPVDALLAAIVAAQKGERRVGPRVENELLAGLACGAVELHGEDSAILSNRELEIFQRIGAGQSVQSVATELQVSVKTVHTHRQRIKDKLNLANGAELQRRAVLFVSRPELR